MIYDDVIAENYEVCDNFQDKSFGFSDHSEFMVNPVFSHGYDAIITKNVKKSSANSKRLV